eukprot:jgi/Psemu1/322016/estExt_fgenesh1_pg.C_160022
MSEAEATTTASTTSVVVDNVIDDFNDGRWEWHNGVPDHSIIAGKKLEIRPTPNKDYWCRTFYDPLLIKTDAETLLARVPAGDEATLATSFTLRPRSQFDQAGIMVLVDENTKLNRPESVQGPCLVFEAAEIGKELEWKQIRIASLRSGTKPWGMGLFAIFPIENKGCSVTFDGVRLGPKENPVHHSEAGIP